MNPTFPRIRSKLLFTPGPLTTSQTVKEAMLIDAGSWDTDFAAIVAEVRRRLLYVASLGHDSGWEAVLLQGCGTYGVEAVFRTAVAPGGKVAVLANGAYGNRMEEILLSAGIQYTVLRAAEDTPVQAEELTELLRQDGAITHVAMVHCETTSGLLNPIKQIGQVAKAQGKIFIVDATSSFGGVPIDFESCGIDYLISSPNKCLESVPGLSLVICRRGILEACQGNARCLSLDLFEQLKAFDDHGRFRFTPPTHALLALYQALQELEREGGVDARAGRYWRNHKILLEGMGELGLQPYLRPEVQSYIITAFAYPRLPGFQFDVLYRQLSHRGYLIYPGKLTGVETFRIGTIGHVVPVDIQNLVQAIVLVLTRMEMGRGESIHAANAAEPAHS